MYNLDIISTTPRIYILLNWMDTSNFLGPIKKVINPGENKNKTAKASRGFSLRIKFIHSYKSMLCSNKITWGREKREGEPGKKYCQCGSGPIKRQPTGRNQATA